VLIRFFCIVRPWHPLVAAGLIVAVVLGGFLLAAGGIQPADALAPILLLQTLSVSSGFAGPARRGHYDFLIASGQKRLAIAAAHWAVSASPGMSAWLVLALIDLVANGGSALLSPQVCTGLMLSSTLPWAVTVPLPRLSGGLVWLVFDRVTSGAVATVVPTAVAAVAAGAAMAAAIVWIHRADFPLEAAQ
jgi:hypothetical protein